MLIDGQKALPLRRHGNAVRRVQMDHAAGVVTVHVQSGVDREAGGIHWKRRVDDLVSFDVDLNETRRGDFLEHESIWIDQEVMFRPGYASRDVGEDHVVPTM